MGIKALDVVKMCSDKEIRPEVEESVKVFCSRADRVANDIGVSSLSAEYIDERNGVVIEMEVDDLEISGRTRALYELLVLSSNSVAFRYVNEDCFAIDFYMDNIYEE